MVTAIDARLPGLASEPTMAISEFHVEGLFGRISNTIKFPSFKDSAEPSLLILQGPNGCGKTTVLNMIAGIISNLDFNPFRRFPFKAAHLSFTNGSDLSILPTGDKLFPLSVSFMGRSATLSKDKTFSYPPRDLERIQAFRQIATSMLKGVSFQLLDIKRSAMLREADPGRRRDGELLQDVSGRILRVVSEMKREGIPQEPHPLSAQIRSFIAAAQVNYRAFFSADELNLLPRILHRLSDAERPAPSRAQLFSRVNRLAERQPHIKSLGLQTDDSDLDSLRDLLKRNDWNAQALAVLASYVEIQEAKSASQNLIAYRLSQFERIMDDFLVDKSVRIHAEEGLRIETSTGPILESDLSSGEHHFLCMMVSALVASRQGTIIAIDEPELSLHVSWQRKVVRALASCASGASPLFLFATHSSAIAAEHRDCVINLPTETA